MKAGYIFGAIILGILLAVGWYFYIRPSPRILIPVENNIERPLDKYTIDALSKRTYPGSQIVLDSVVATTNTYTVSVFHYISDGKRVNGLAHIPSHRHDSGNQRIKVDQRFPVIVQFRGYVDPKHYVSGVGTKRSAEVFAEHGFISLAPDFLGYGGSASPSADVFEERFESYTTAMNLLSSIKTLPMADPDHIGIWGHSNGGQIALTILEMSGKPYPTTLWAPVSKPFPYSILYFTDDIEDHGKALRKKTAEFESLYDAELYSLPNYLDRIFAPIQLHQGTADEAVPQKWSDDLVTQVQSLKSKVQISYYVYPGADHNMNNAWNTVVLRDVEFFKSELK